MPQMHKPLLIPDGVEGDLGDFGKRGSDVRPAERAEAVLRLRADVRIARIGFRAQRFQREIGRKVRLEQFVYMRVGCQAAPVMQVARDGIGLIHQSRDDAVLDSLPGQQIRHVVNTRQIRRHLLADFLRAKCCRRDQQLRDVRPGGFAGKRAAKQQIRRHFAVNIFGTRIRWHGREFRRRFCRYRIAGIIRERDIAEQRTPVQFGQFRSVSGACQRGRRGHNRLGCRGIAELLRIRAH